MRVPWGVLILLSLLDQWTKRNEANAQVQGIERNVQKFAQKILSKVADDLSSQQNDSESGLSDDGLDNEDISSDLKYQHANISMGGNSRNEDGFFVKKNGSYVIFDERFTWPVAVEKCHQQGMQLACASADQLLELFGIKPGDDTNVWIRSRNCTASQTMEDYTAAEIFNMFPEKSDIAYSYAPDGKLPFACSKADPFPSRLRSGQTRPRPSPMTSPVPVNSKTHSVESTTAATTKDIDYDSKNSTQTSRGCQPTRKRGMIWESKSEGIVKQQCPESAHGFVKWNCTLNGEWFPDHPDLSECRSSEMQSFLDQLPEAGVLETSGLLRIYSGSAIYGGDLLSLVGVLENVTHRFSAEIDDVDEKLNFTYKFTLDITSSVSQLIENDTAWHDLPQTLRSEFASKVLKSTEQVAFILGEFIESSSFQEIEHHNFLLHVAKHPRGSYADRPFILPSADATGEDQITMPPGFEDDLNSLETNDTLAVFIRYKDLRSILPDDNRLSSKSGRQLNSAVISLSFEQTTNAKPLSRPFHLRLNHLLAANLSDEPACVFWNFYLMSWDDKGCRSLPGGKDGTTVCECDHLTNFALLMDIHGAMELVSESHKTNLHIITMIGCGLSVFCLFFCVVVYTVYSFLNAVRTTIIRNICISLLMAEVLLLAGFDRTEFKVLCPIVAALLHFFFLSAFCWMLLEAFYIYINLYKIFPSSRSYYHRYYLFGYGMPFFIVVSSAAIMPSGYSREDSCWLSTSNGFIWAYTGPVLAILSVNAVALIFAVKTVTQASSKNRKPVSQTTKTFLKSTLILLPLLGLTWVPGFLFYDRHTLTWAYVFTALNVVQGVAIFVCHCLVNQKARQCIRKSFSVAMLSIGLGASTSQGTDGNACTVPTLQQRKTKTSSSPTNFANGSYVFGSSKSSYKLQSTNSSRAARGEVYITSSEDGLGHVVLQKVSAELPRMNAQ